MRATVPRILAWSSWSQTDFGFLIPRARRPASVFQLKDDTMFLVLDLCPQAVLVPARVTHPDRCP